MAHYFGGKSFYLPAGDKIKEALRDAQIYQEFNGKNVPELIKNTDCQKAQFMRSYAINERFKESDIRWILILVSRSLLWRSNLEKELRLLQALHSI